MSTAQKIVRQVQDLPEAQAQEVLDFVAFLKARNSNGGAARRAALAGLAQMRGRYKAEKFDRDELHDRACLR
jgi:hypothetical protein